MIYYIIRGQREAPTGTLRSLQYSRQTNASQRLITSDEDVKRVGIPGIVSTWHRVERPNGQRIPM